MMQKSGKVVVSQHYPPDPSTTAAIMAAISERVARERDVLVLSGTAGSAAKAAAGKPPVVEVKNWMPGKGALLKRALAELLFTIRMFFALLMKLRRGDVALTVPAPFMLPYAFAAAAKLKGARSVLIMHDLYPDVLIMAGLLKPDSLPAKAMRGLNALMFRALDAVVVIGLFAHDPFIVFEAARLLRDDKDIHFLLSGWGIGFDQLREMQSAAKLPNVTLVDRVEDDQLETFLSAADAWIIPYRRNVAGVLVPSRFYNLLAIGRPVILVSNPMPRRR